MLTKTFICVGNIVPWCAKTLKVAQSNIKRAINQAYVKAPTLNSDITE